MIHTPDDPIAALATPLAPSALAVIRVSGAGSLALLSRLLSGGGDIGRRGGNTIHRRVIRDGAEDVDEVMVAVYKAPRSYTGEDGAEIFCHGSLPVMRRIMSLLGRSGFRPAGPGEFTQRAFLRGKMDLTRAEAVNEIVRAKTDRARGLALQRLSGAIEGRIREARDNLVEIRASLEVMIDYPDEDPGGGAVNEVILDRTIALLAGLAKSYARGRIYQEGASVAIAGATNSGKSSLFNLLLKQDRAIVSEIHGTTRDYLEEVVSIEGIPIRLFDTAGMRDSSDPLEREGMRRTESVLEGADLVVFIVDSTRAASRADEELLARLANGGRRGLVRAWNKTDLPESRPAPAGFVRISALTGEGIQDLERAISTAVLIDAPAETGEPLLDSERQRDLIERSLAALARFRLAREGGMPLDCLAVDLAEALEALGEITGEVTSTEILERMFSTFCVGK